MTVRTTQEVLNDHLDCSERGALDEDITRNFADDCVLLSSFGVFHRHQGVRESRELLKEQLGPSQYHYRHRLWHGDLAFCEWTAQGERASVADGADSYLVRDGKIRVMTIHYNVRKQDD